YSGLPRPSVLLCPARREWTFQPQSLCGTKPCMTARQLLRPIVAAWVVTLGFQSCGIAKKSAPASLPGPNNLWKGQLEATEASENVVHPNPAHPEVVVVGEPETVGGRRAEVVLVLP